jgi:NADPH:quinone reductase-like Zn-dependent oxidoreductase
VLGERSVDIVLDPVGGDRMTDSLRSLAPLGRLLVVGFAGGEIPVVKVNRLLLGNTGVLGVAFREFFENRPEVVGELWSSLAGLRRAGKLGDPPVMAFPFADARGALRAIADRRARGKVVLSQPVSDPPAPGPLCAPAGASVPAGASIPAVPGLSAVSQASPEEPGVASDWG